MVNLFLKHSLCPLRKLKQLHGMIHTRRNRDPWKNKLTSQLTVISSVSAVEKKSLKKKILAGSVSFPRWYYLKLRVSLLFSTQIDEEGISSYQRKIPFQEKCQSDIHIDLVWRSHKSAQHPPVQNIMPLQGLQYVRNFLYL